jgi:hypothetical protein
MSTNIVVIVSTCLPTALLAWPLKTPVGRWIDARSPWRRYEVAALLYLIGFTGLAMLASGELDPTRRPNQYLEHVSTGLVIVLVLYFACLLSIGLRRHSRNQTNSRDH